MHQFCLLCYHGGYTWGPTGWSYQAFKGEQIAFFRSQSDPAVPALAFAHVPVPEYATMADTPARQQKSAMVGDRFDAICPSATDSLYTELAAQKVVAMSVGHDHTNDFCAAYQGIQLCYEGSPGYQATFVRHLSDTYLTPAYQAYGRDGWSRRARVTQITDHGRNVISWKRLDDAEGSVVDRETLFSAVAEAGNLPMRRPTGVDVGALPELRQPRT